jgi:hypothetical protein
VRRILCLGTSTDLSRLDLGLEGSRPPELLLPPIFRLYLADTGRRAALERIRKTGRLTCIDTALADPRFSQQDGSDSRAFLPRFVVVGIGCPCPGKEQHTHPPALTPSGRPGPLLPKLRSNSWGRLVASSCSRAVDIWSCCWGKPPPSGQGPPQACIIAPSHPLLFPLHKDNLRSPAFSPCNLSSLRPLSQTGGFLSTNGIQEFCIDPPISPYLALRFRPRYQSVGIPPQARH